MNRRIKKKHFRTVLNKLSSEPLFMGRYDAINGDDNYMYGIAAVMDLIAYEAGCDDFQDVFVQNLLKSKEREHGNGTTQD